MKRRMDRIIEKSKHEHTVKILKIQTLEKFAVITLKFEQGGFTVEKCIQKIQAEWQTV